MTPCNIERQRGFPTTRASRLIAGTRHAAIDTMTEEDLLRGLQKQMPEEPSASENRVSSPSARRYEKLVGGREEEEAL